MAQRDAPRSFELYVPDIGLLSFAFDPATGEVSGRDADAVRKILAEAPRAWGPEVWMTCSFPIKRPVRDLGSLAATLAARGCQLPAELWGALPKPRQWRERRKVLPGELPPVY